MYQNSKNLHKSLLSIFVICYLLAMLPSATLAQVWLPSMTIGVDKTSDSGIGMPWDVDVTSNGDIYVADHTKLQVKVYNSTGNLLRSFGGSGTGQGSLTGLNGIAVSNDNFVYVTDRDVNRVVEYTASGTFVRFLATGSLYSPRGLAVDGNTLVVTDAWNSRVVRLSRSDGSVISSFGSFGSGAGQFNDPQSLDVAPNGDIVVVDTYNNRVQVFSSSGVFKRMFGTYGSGDGQFSYPHGISVDDSGYIYVSDTRKNRYQRFTSKGVWTTTVNATAGKDYFGIDVDKDGRAYMCNIVSGVVEIYEKISPRYQLKNQVKTRDNNGTKFNYLTGVAEDSLGNVYVTEYFDGLVFKFDPNFTPLGPINPTYSLTYPYALTVDSQNRVIIANAVSYGNSVGNLVRIDPTNPNPEVFGSMSLPTAVAVGENRHLYSVETYGHKISEFDENGIFLRSYGSQGTGDVQFNYPQGIVVGNDGLLYVSDTENNRVQVLSESGQLIRQWAVPDVPDGISMDVAGNVIVTQRVGRRFSVYSSTGTFLFSGYATFCL